MFQIAPEGIENDHRARVSDVNQVIDGRPADIHTDLAFLKRFEFLFGHGQGVEYFHKCVLPFGFFWYILRDHCLLCKDQASIPRTL